MPAYLVPETVELVGHNITKPLPVVRTLLKAVYVPDHNRLWVMDYDVHAIGWEPHPWACFRESQLAREIHWEFSLAGILGQAQPFQWFRMEDTLDEGHARS